MSRVSLDPDELRLDRDTAAQFAVAWAEQHGMALAIFRREGHPMHRILIQLGPAPGSELPPMAARAFVARTTLCGVMWLEVVRERRRVPLSALALLSGSA